MTNKKDNRDSVKNHNVILYVDTANIKKDTITENTSFDQYDMNLNNHDYRTYVNGGDSISWSGLSISAPNDKVIITKIKHDSKSNIFGRKNLYGGCCDTDGKIVGTAKNTTDNKYENYSIYFKICEGNNGGMKKAVYRVDPEIRVRPPGSGG